MSPTEIEVFRDLINTLRQDMHKELEKLTGQIEKLSTKIEDFQKQTGLISIEIGVIKERQKNIKDDIDNNFTQHAEFYDRLGKLEKIPDISQKAEDNENEIIRIKTTGRTAYIIFGVIITLLGILFKFKII